MQSELEKAIKEIKNKKATGDDDVPGDVLKLFEGVLKIMTKLINTIYETGVAQGLHGSYNVCLREEATSNKMQRPSHNQPYHTYSEDSSKKNLEEGLKRKLRMYSEKISLDLEEEKELRMQLGC